MYSFLENSDPTWTQVITKETPRDLHRKKDVSSFPTVVLFALSTLVASAAADQHVPLRTSSSASISVVRKTRSTPFDSSILEAAWASAMNVIRDLGESPDDVLRRASETVERLRSASLPQFDDTNEVDEDEI